MDRVRDGGKGTSTADEATSSVIFEDMDLMKQLLYLPSRWYI
jgi:hypothetical protein